VEERSAEQEPRKIEMRDAAVMRALAHPARLAIIEHLFAGNAGTATELAAVCDLSPSATSYHLRALAKAGMIEEAPSRGDGRERIWQTPARGLNITVGPAGTPAEQAAERELTETFMNVEDARVREWLVRRNHESQEWYEASEILATRLVLTVEELQKLNEEVTNLLRPYSRSRRTDPPADARLVNATYRAYPAAP
jgi:DNA-binding transcriptional ArsR family regulator